MSQMMNFGLQCFKKNLTQSGISWNWPEFRDRNNRIRPEHRNSPEHTEI